MAKERIQKVLAAAGFGSRRSCEALVTAGRVSINGRLVRDIPLLVDPQKDRIAVDRKLIRTERRVYFLLHKPRRVYCTNNDPAGRKRAVDLMTGVRERVFPVGRLDADSAGLLIMTNDGELTQKLTHPRFATPKTYRVEIQGSPKTDVLDKLRQGVWLSGGKTAPAEIKIIHKDRQMAVLEITLREGRNREIRRMLARLGHKVRRLTRIRMGRLSIRGLPLGAYRPLTSEEVKYLYRLAERSESVPGSRKTARPKPKSKSIASKHKPVKTKRPAVNTKTRRTLKNNEGPANSLTPRRKRRIIMPKE